jgi:molybdate transport system ATP-binding protein
MSANLDISFELELASYPLKINTQLPGQGVTVIYGPSGSGKTSLLRCVAGLEVPTRSEITIGSTVWHSSSRSIFLPTHRRALGYVFQEGSLFEHLNALDNVRYGLKPSRSELNRTLTKYFKKQRIGQSGIADSLNEAIDLLGINKLLNRMPAQLSGGERQRVAIARAVARVLAFKASAIAEVQSSVLLLMDEPLASLDTSRRQEVLGWLERIREQLKVPMLYVTHSNQELVRLADHLLVLEQGQQIASGPVHQVLSDPSMAQVMGGEIGALVSGEITAFDPTWHLARVSFSGGQLWIKDENFKLQQTVRLRLIASDLSLSAQTILQGPDSLDATVSSVQNQLTCTVDSVHSDHHPAFQLVRLRCAETALLARVTSRAANQLNLRSGLPVIAQVKAVALLS